MKRLFQLVAHNGVLRRTRRVLRTLPGGGLLLKTVSRSLNQKYEQRFNDAMMAAVTPGLTVWDVGANVGFYTREFLERVGPSGKVVAVEPSPASAEHVRAIASANDGRLTVIEGALGAESGHARFNLDGNNPTSVTNAVRHNGNTEVAIWTGDDLIDVVGSVPNLIKIDVEGFEVEVVDGMKGRLLNQRELCWLFVEIHNSQMESLGIREGGQQIETILASSGFKVDWVDFSHLVAIRPKSNPVS